MPLYEYRCSRCRHTFEILQSLGAGPQGLICPECGGGDLNKQFSTFAASTASSSTGAGASGCAVSGSGSGFT